MKRAFISIAVSFALSACCGSADLDGRTTDGHTADGHTSPDDCSEAVCNPSEHTVRFPVAIEHFDVAGKCGQFTIAWQEDASDMSRGYVTAVDANDPLETPAFLELESTEDGSLGVDNPQVLWFERDPRIIYTRFNGESGQIVSRILVSEPDKHLLAGEIMASEGHVSLSRAVHHPSGEIGLSWTAWSSPDADPRAWLGRYSEEGDLIQASEIASSEYAYGPRLKPVADGYSIAYTANDDPDHRRVISTNWSFTSGMAEPVQLNSDIGSFTVMDLATTPAMNVVLWQYTPNPSYPDFNVAYLSWIDLDGVRDSMVLDEVVIGPDMLVTEEGEALVSWCSIDIETMETSLNVARVEPGSFSTVLRMDLGEDACNLTQLVSSDGHPTLFWAQSGSREIHFKAFCD